MKTRLAFISILLISNSLILSGQLNPVIIDLRSNGNKLDAKFYQVEKVISSPTVILLHGFPGNANSPYDLAERLIKNGINVLYFNYEGSFNSEGIFSWENCMNDVGVALSFLKQKNNINHFSIDTSKIFVCGCSQGAAYALSAAVHNPDIRRLIAVVGGNDLSIYLQKMGRDPAFRTTLENRFASVCMPNGPIKGDLTYIRNYFEQIISKYEYFDLIKNAEQLKNREILFITGWLDTRIPMEEFIIPTYRHLKNMNPEFVSIKGFEADHNFTNKRDELANSISEWIKSK
jgi:uncharacterized protein